MNFKYFAREQWGADPTLPRLGRASTKQTSLHIHHTAAPAGTLFGFDQAKRYMRSLQRARPDLGLDIPYHFVAAIIVSNNLETAPPVPWAAIFEGRGWGRSAAHALPAPPAPGIPNDFNYSGISIALMGDHHSHSSSLQVGLLQAIDAFLRGYGGTLRFTRLSPSGRLAWGHCESDPVRKPACPGQHVFPYLGLIEEGAEEEMDLKYGDGPGTGKEGHVKRLQDMLKEASIRWAHPPMAPAGGTTGNYAIETKEAVLAFQRFIGLSANGVADSMTVAILAAQTQGRHQHAVPIPGALATAEEAW